MFAPTPVPAQSPDPSPAPDIAGSILQGFWQGLTAVAVQQPWLVVVVGLLIVSAAVRSARVVIHSGPRDPVRLFPRADKTLLLAWAGHRCEHHARVGGRCPATEKLQADHVHPWSRGGATHVGNGQILCRAHNREKNASIPWDRSLRRLADKRAAYYPADVSRTVRRKRPTSVLLDD